MTVNFYDLCRVCTANTNLEQKIHIFSAEGKRKNLNTKIAECLALNIEEKDRLPKVLCGQCLQHVESNMEFRDICKKSQVTLINWLNSASNNSPKVYIKDEISASSGKSLSVLGSTSAAVATSSVATTTAQMPMVTYTTPTLMNNNEMINSIVQVTGLQQTIDMNQNADKQQTLPQYTITVDKNFNRPASQILQQQTQPAEKDVKSNTLEEFLKLKKNIKVTPIRKDTQKQQQSQQQQQQQQQNSLSQQQEHTQAAQIQPQQITVQAQHIALPTQAPATAIPQQISQLQLQQLLQQQIQQQWQQQLQQQQFQQQLQQLSTQFQPQQITITAPAPTQAATALTPSTSSLNDSLSPSKSKKPKLNFVLTPPSANQASNSTSTFQQITGTNTVTPTVTQQPQIQLQFQPNTQQLQSLQQHQPTANAANLLTNLAPLLQQSVNMTAPLTAATGAASMLSPNKCFLPITIKDESSDQQIVAHIDAKNFVFPTTYQLQMKLQPQIATVDGQPIMQLTPTSIPATLQLTPQALPNQTFQALLNTTTNSLQQPQIIQQIQQQQQQQQPQQQHQQPTHAQEQTQLQFSQSLPTTNNLQITSHQILQTANNNAAPALANTTITEQQENMKPKTQTQNTISQQKFKITQLPGNAFEITPTNDYETTTTTQTTTTTKTTTLPTAVQQKLTPPKQQQQQIQNQITLPTSLPTQFGGITVQRISTTTKAPNTTPTAQKTQEQQPQSTQGAKSISATPTKTNVWQKQNLTISRISAQQQQQQPSQTPQQQQQSQAKPTTTSVKPAQQNQKLLMQTTNNTKKIQTQQIINQQPIQIPIEQQLQQQQSTKKVVRRVLNKTKQEPQQRDTPAIIKIESLPTINKSLTVTTTNAATTSLTPSTVTPSTTKVSMKKENQNATSKSTTTADAAAGAADNNNATAVATSTTTTGTTQGFECGQCHRFFKKKEHLTQHAKLHAGIRPFKCTQAGCDKDFSRKEHLLRHIVSHSGEKQFSCDVCEKPFSRKDNLNKHRRIHQSAQNSNNYTCEICNKSFAIKLHYEEHKELHVKQETNAPTQPKKSLKTQQRTITIQQQQQQPQQQQSQNHNQQQQSQNQNQQQQHQHQPLPQQTQHIQFVQTHHQHHPQQQQQTMHLQLPTVVTTQDLAGNTITITQSTDPNKAIGNHDTTVLNLPSHLANLVQLGQAQFVNAATGQIVSHIKIDK